MPFKRMEIEEWFDRYQYATDFDIGESGVKFATLEEIGLELGQIPLRYGHHRGAPELRERIAQDYPGVGIEQIAVTNGASEAIFAVIASLVGPGDQVIVEHPNYPSLYEAPLSLGHEVKYYHLSFGKRFKIDLQELERQVGPRTKLVLLTHPNNPTGSVLGEAELLQVIQFCEARDLYLLLDETYRELSFEEALPPAATLSPKAISITSMSKSYRVPGIRIGWVVADEEVIESVRAVREQITICNSAISERIALHLLNQKEQLLAETKELVNKNLDILIEWMETRSDLEWVPPSGGVVAFPRITEGGSSELLCRRLMEKYRTFVVPGYCFGMPEHFRIGFGGESEELIGGLACLDEALKEYGV